MIGGVGSFPLQILIYYDLILDATGDQIGLKVNPSKEGGALQVLTVPSKAAVIDA